MKHNYQAIYSHVRIRPLEEKDIELLRIWRNDPKKTQYLREIGEITPEMQKAWFDDSQKNSDEILFAIDEIKDLKRMVGSLALYNFRDGVADIGKIQIGDVEANGRGIGRISLVLAMYLGFQHIGLNKITGKVREDNVTAYHNDIRVGFQVVGKEINEENEKVECSIEITYDRLQEVNPYIKYIISKG